MTTEDMLRRAREASAAASPVGDDVYRLFVKAVRDRTDEHWERILDSNTRDLNRAREQGLPEPLIQRLRLTDRQKTALERAYESIERDLPRDETVELIHGDDGIRSRKVLRPLGVILMIFEARAEIALRAAAMCGATGNAVLLRGGSEISQTISAIGDLLDIALADAGLPHGLVAIVDSTDRAQLRELLRRDDAIDVIIPRGSPSLIEHCRTASRIPLIASSGGANHVYVHRSADPHTAVRLVLDAKLRDPAACTAVEMALIDEQVVDQFLAALAETPDTGALMLRVPENLTVPDALRDKIDQIPLAEHDNGCEFLSPTLALRPVPDADAAIEHINRHGSGHTEGVLATDPAVGEKFARRVDAATVVVNGSLLLNDAPSMGLGAALAISTARLHVRGPVTLTALYTHSWIIDGADTARTA